MHESFNALVPLLKHSWAVSLIIAVPVGVFVGILVGLMMLRKSSVEERKHDEFKSQSLPSKKALPAKPRRFIEIFWIVVIAVAVTDVIATLVWGVIHGR